MRLTDFLETYPGTDADFAETIGVTAQALSRYRLGERRPKWEVLERIQRVTDGAVTPNDFLLLVPPDAQPDTISEPAL